MSTTRKMLLTDTFEVKGIWFLPGSDMSKKGIQGILKYSPSDIKLELIGTLEDSMSFKQACISSPLTIYGFSDSGEWFTLYQCLPSHAHMSPPGFDTITYSVGYFYSGTKIIKNEHDQLVKNVTFSYTNLDAWLDYNIIERCKNRDAKKATFVIDLNAPWCDRQTISIPARALLLEENIRYDCEVPKNFLLNEKTEIVLKRFYCFSPSTDTLLSPKYLFECTQQLGRLLTLLIGRAMYFSCIEFNFPSTKANFPYAPEEEYETKQHCKMFFKQVGDISKVKTLSPNDSRSILIKRADIKKNMETIFNYWFEWQNELFEITGAYLSDRYSLPYLENKYLNIVRGLETYHRFFIENKKDLQPSNQADDQELDQSRELILTFINQNISEANREYFIKRVCYEDENSLRKRLKELLCLTPAKLSNLLFGEMNSKEKNKLISSIVDTRNYFTHRDDKKKYINIVDEHATLPTLTKHLSILLQYFCLTQIGVDPSITEQRLIEQMH